MTPEKNYDFIRRLHEVHERNRRDSSAHPLADETVAEENWQISIPVEFDPMIDRAAADFQDYLRVSMNLSIPIVRSGEPGPRRIAFAVKPDSGHKPDTYAISVTADSVLVTANTPRAVLHAAVHLEDRMNMREAPFLKQGDYLREPLTRMRSVHSGSGIDEFSDAELNAILHAGFNAIDVFVSGIDRTAKGPNRIGAIIERAAKYGIDVVLYNYIRCYVHPDDKDAEKIFDSVYGTLFRKYPQARAISLVGESLEFPSKDPATSGKRCSENIVDGIPDTRPSPGWYPCSDYPAFLSRIRDAVHKVKPSAEIIFSTYNWGWTPEPIRRKFLENFPKGITLQITYEIFKQNMLGDLHTPVMDYTVSAVEPGFYFTSEAENAHRLGIPIRVTSNLAGTTWDFGTAPYVPVPQRWLKRMLIMRDWLKKCGVDSFYENHHYGWWPNPAIDLAKEIFYSPESDSGFLTGFLNKLAMRDYGKLAAYHIVQAWEAWSGAMDDYVASNEDQYGPWRVGSAYPFIFQPNISRTMSNKEIQFPTDPTANNGWHIVKTFYTPYENENQTPGPLRCPREVEKLEKMLELWNKGLADAEKALKLAPEGRKHDNAERLCALGRFIRNSIRTTIGIKRWWMLNLKLQTQSERKPMLEILDRIEELARAEMENVKDTIPSVELDSRIGWEPSMEYVCDKWHLEWKLRQLESALREISDYRKMILL